MLIVKLYHVFIQIFPSSEDTRICENIGERSITSMVMHYRLAYFYRSSIKYSFFLCCYMRLLCPILPQDCNSIVDRTLPMHPPVELFNKVCASTWKLSYRIAFNCQYSILNMNWMHYISLYSSSYCHVFQPTNTNRCFAFNLSCPLDLKEKVV